jgi:hypothetical protein
MISAPHLSIPKLSCRNPPPKERLFFVLKAYFDGCSDGKQERFLTLGGIVASAKAWTDFEAEWQAVLLSKEYNVDWFHMTAAMAKPPQDQFRGWCCEEAHRLVKELLNIIGKFRGSPEFLVKSCTVDLAAYNNLKNTEGTALRTKEEICVNVCCGSALPSDPDSKPGELQKLELYFDVKEKFKDRIERVWSRHIKRRVHPTWVDQIVSIAPVRQMETPALQAADTVAWAVNAFYCGDERARAYFFMMRIGQLHEFYDHERIKKEFVRSNQAR